MEIYIYDNFTYSDDFTTNVHIGAIEFTFDSPKDYQYYAQISDGNDNFYYSYLTDDIAILDLNTSHVDIKVFRVHENKNIPLNINKYSYSIKSIPEPASLALIAGSAGVLLFVKRRFII